MASITKFLKKKDPNVFTRKDNLTTGLGSDIFLGIPEYADEEIFIQHAQMEWQVTGHDPDEFDMQNFADYVIERDYPTKRTRMQALNPMRRLNPFIPTEDYAANKAIQNRRRELREQSQLQSKNEVMQKKLNRSVKAQAKYAAETMKEVADGASWLKKSAYKVIVEPNAHKRARGRRENEKKVAMAESEFAHGRLSIKERVEYAEAYDERELQLDGERRARLEAIGPSQKILGDLVKSVDQERKERDLEHFRERRKATSDARLREIEFMNMEQEAKIKKRQEEIREWRVGHWSEQSKLLVKESNDRGIKAREDRLILANDFIESDEAEHAQREMDRAMDQVLGPSISNDASAESLGIFGKPLEPGEFLSAAKGGSQDGIDDMTVPLWNSTPITTFEDHTVVKYDLHAEVGRTSELYDALTIEENNLTEQKQNLIILKERLVAEITQQDSENNYLGNQMAGPPRRDATSKEIVATKERKDRGRELRQQVSEIEHRLELVDQDKNSVSSQSLETAKRLASLREKLQKKEEQLEVVNEGLGELPMVVGRNISKVPGGVGDFFGKPKKTLEKITQESKLEIIAAQSEKILNVHRSARQLDHAVWMKEEQKRNENLHYEDMLTSLANAADRVKNSRAEFLRSDIIQALKLFFASGMKLNVVNIRYSGPVNWWRSRHKQLCNNLQRWCSSENHSELVDDILVESRRIAAREARRAKLTAYNEQKAKDGIFADDLSDDEDGEEADLTPEQIAENEELELARQEAEGEGYDSDNDPDSTKQGVGLGENNAGILIGELELPKYDMYEFEVVVTKTYPYALTQGDPNDFVRIKMGPNLRSLTVVATIYNEPNEDDGQFRHVIKHTFRTDTLAYRFEFQSSETAIDNHMVIEAGSYDQTELPPLDCQPGTNRVLSSFVKMMRIDQMTGKGQFARFLSELILAEESSDEWHDSNSFLGTEQRYKRIDFIKLMKRHLIHVKKKEDDAAKAEMEKMLGGGTLNTAAHREKMAEAEETRRKRMEESQEQYIHRKRYKQQPLVDAAMEKVACKIECFNKKLQKWQHATITQCRVRWRDNGIKAEIRHKIQRFNDENMLVGRATWHDLNKLRYYIAKKADIDEAALAQWKANEEMRQAVLKEEKEAEAKRLEKVTERRKQRDESQLQFDMEKFQAIEERRREAEQEAKQKLRNNSKNKDTLAVVKAARKRLIEEWKVGIGTPDGLPQTLSTREANRMARANWTEIYIKEEVEDEEEDWVDRAEDRQEILAKEDAKWARQDEREDAILKAQKDIRDKRLTEIRRQRKIQTAKRMTISVKDFEKAVPKAKLCEHLRCKSWGDCYGKGVRCIDCGKEILLTHEEEGQKKGMGTGDDPQLILDVDRHRRNEASFRFRRADELVMVEKERRRLEKDRWDQYQNEPFFYDFEDITQIYEFDRRHKYFFRQIGVVRQGVQWRDEDLTAYFEGREKELKALSPESRKAKKFELESWVQDNRPPTFRKEGLTHRAQFRDTVQTFARIKNFRTRLWFLRNRRIDLMADVKMYDDVLHYLHERIWTLEMHLKHVERDLKAASTTMMIRQLSVNQHNDAKEILEIGDQDRREKEMLNAGKDEKAEAVEQEAREVGETVRALLRQRVWVERRLEGVLERKNHARERADANLKLLGETQRKVESIHYRRRGTIIPTPYGHCQVLLFREDDEMVIVQLPNKAMQIRMYIPLEVCMQAETAVSEATRVAMEDDEAKTKEFYRTELNMRREESVLMAAEEKALKEQLKFEAEVQAEEDKVELTVRQCMAETKLFLKNKEGKVKIRELVEMKLEEAQKRLDRDINLWAGVGKKPKRLNLIEQARFRVAHFTEVKWEFLADTVADSERNAREAIAKKHKNRAELATFDFVINGFLKDFIFDVADESLRTGLEAKARSEAETGIVFPKPAHMQYNVYNTLSSWWMNKKKVLQKNLEKWGARSAQDELRWEAEKQNRAKLMRDVELRDQKEREKKRQNEVCREMYSHEMYVRQFYKDEMKLCLSERRAMREAEVETIMYNKELKILEDLKNSKYAVGTYGDDDELGGMTAKERRRLELKKGTADKARLQKEIKAMMEEDELAQAVRAEEKMIEQQEALKREMELYGLGDDADDDDEDYDSEMESEESGMEDDEPEPQGLTPEELKLWRRERRAKKRREKAAARANEKRLAAEKEAADQLERSALKFKVDFATAELQWMEHEEEAKVAERELRECAQNVRKVTLYCQIKGQEELRLKARARKFREEANKYGKKMKDAFKWYLQCVQETDRCKRVRVRTFVDTEFTDTSAICGFHQRYLTEKLFARLRHMYFETLAVIVVNRAELVATERAMMRFNEELVSNEKETSFKTLGLANLWKEQKRMEFLRMFRSELGKTIFSKWRNKILVVAYQGWVRFWSWHQGMRAAFSLRYEVIKQKLDIKRLHKDVSQINERREHGGLAEDLEAAPLFDRTGEESDFNGKFVEDAGGAFNAGGKATELVALKQLPQKSLHQRHVSRPVRCRLCKKYYLESQNTDQSCLYHPGEYTTTCPQWCTGLTAACMTHRTPRWNCCDVRDKGKFGSSGCMRRNHMPYDVDPDYKFAVDTKTAFYHDAFAKQATEMVDVRENNWIVQARKVKRDQLAEIFDGLEVHRKVIRRFEGLELDDTDLEKFEVDQFTGEVKLIDPTKRN